jgi:Ca-activated chloride channel family protein
MRTYQSSPVSSAFGLVAWLEMTRVVLPLKGVECRFEVTGGVASVELDQIYHQENAVALDCTYLFPLPAEAAVYRCELIVNGRVIRAIVEEEQAAKKIYAEKKAAGHRVAMVESERENLFTLSLGNVQPGDVVVVRLAWFQVLDRLGAEGLRMLVPTCPGVRYIPGKPLLRSNSGRGTEADTDQVPDASRITPPRISELHPDAAYFALSGRLSRADAVTGSVSSPTHVLLVRETADAVMVELADRGEVPDQDFVLAWREPAARTLEPQAWRWEGDDARYALVQLRAPEDVAVAENVAQDFYFLVDRSGSMRGRKWEQTCRALRSFVGLLGTEDRVWITLFESRYQDYAEKPLPAPRVRADVSFQQMVKQGVGGGTELLPAAEHVLEVIARHSPGRTATVVLITDGEVGNDAQIIAAFRRSPEVRVHTFGIDTAVNDAFLKTLAREHRGGCWLQSPHDNIAGTVAALGGQLRRPVITQLAIGAGWEAGAALLPDLHAGQVVTLPLRGDRASALEITGRLANGETHRFAVPLETAGTPATPLLWARERMSMLLAANRAAEAVALAKKSNLICEGAVFVAWDEAEKVTVARREVVQPALEQKALFCALSAPPRSRTSSKIGSWDGTKELGDLPGDDSVALGAPYADIDAAPEEKSRGISIGRRYLYSGVEESAQLSETQILWKDKLAPALVRLGFPVEKLPELMTRVVPEGPSWFKGVRDWLFTRPQLEALQASLTELELVLGRLVIPLARKITAEMLADNPAYRAALVSVVRNLVDDFRRLAAGQQRLLACGVPPGFAQAIVEWVLDGSFKRHGQFDALVARLGRPDAAAPSAAIWQRWLDETVGRESALYVAARAWLPELAPAEPVPSTAG